MKKVRIVSCFLFIGFLLIQLTSFSQESYLKLTHKKRGDVEKLVEGDRVKVVTYDNKIFNGELQFYNDTMAKVGRFYVPFSNFKEVKRINTGQQLVGLGIILMTIAAEITLVRAWGTSQTLMEFVFIGAGIYLMPIIPLTISTLLIVVHKRYDIRDDWKMEFVTEEKIVF